MSQISIKALLAAHVGANGKTWDHDRSSTVGASEVGQCLRKIWFVKNQTPPEYKESYGARLRGDLIESHYWEPGLRSQFSDQLLYAGKDQKTFVDGYLSATSDGLLVGLPRDALAHYGIKDMGSDCLVVECKSIDPRVDLKEAKEGHKFQIQCQMGLIRRSTPYRPNYALISYTNASFLDEITEFASAFDDEIYEAAKDRALQVMTADAALDLPPEGKIAGGKECDYCPYKQACAGETAGAIPKDEQPLGHNAITKLAALIEKEQWARARKEAASKRHAITQEVIKKFLREHETRKVAWEGWSVSYFPVKGRLSLDKDAMKAAGIDLTPFEKQGPPSERLTIRAKS